jgi:hypothetical protein
MMRPMCRARVLLARIAWLSAALCVTTFALCGSAAEPQSDISPAERLIFLGTHMSGVEPHTELAYALNLSGPPTKVNDTVRVLVVSRDNAGNDASVTDRTGKVDVPNEGMPCNPVILYFLEHDIAEMEQLTGGQRRYFQRRVRLALAAGPAVTPVVVQVGGKAVKASKIVIQPYLNDPNASRFELYTGKRYTFVLADEDVPGHVVQISTEVPGKGNDFVHPMQTETLVYQSIAHGLPLPAPGGKPLVRPGQAPSANR